MKRAGIVKTKIVNGRYELGWEVGFLSAAAFNAAASPIVGIQINNDADFFVQKVHAYDFGDAGAKFLFDPKYTWNIKDSATGNEFYRTPASPYHLAQVPYIPRSAVSGEALGRLQMNDKGLPAPYIMRRASSAFITFTKGAGAPAIIGDCLVIFEGFRIYPGEKEPVPQEIIGYNTPYAWAGQITIPNGLAAGFQKLGTVVLAGPGEGKYVLKDASIRTTGTPVAVSGYLPTPDAVLAFQVQDSRNQQKLWARMGQNPSPFGQYMPGFCLTGSGGGLPWVWPRYVEGQDQITLEVFGDPASFTGGNPGILDISLNGVCIYG
jgi:hypothetical protein